MKNSEAVTKICPFMSEFDRSVKCKTCNCMAWENIPKGRDVKENEKEGYCKRLGK